MDKIASFRGKYRFLSNFYPCTITFDGLTDTNSEAAFHAQKCDGHERKIKYTKLTNPIRAKQLGREIVGQNHLGRIWMDIRAEYRCA